MAWYIHIPPTAKTGTVNKNAINEKKDNIIPDRAENKNQITNNIKSAKIIRIKETSQPKACFI